jgi:hypothetical protein
MRTVIEKDPEAIIVIVSDHGSGFGMSLSRSSNSPASLYERYSNLGLWRLPEVCRHMLYPNLSPVNAYPIILACLTGQEPDLIPEAAYYPSVQGTNGQPIWKQVRIDLSRKAATDVTAELRARGILFNK